MIRDILIGVILGLGGLSLWINMRCWRRWAEQPRQREPEPYVTPQSLATGGVEGLELERLAILEALRLVRLELRLLRRSSGRDVAEELRYALAEYRNYSDRLRDVEEMAKEYKHG